MHVAAQIYSPVSRLSGVYEAVVIMVVHASTQGINLLCRVPGVRPSEDNSQFLIYVIVCTQPRLATYTLEIALPTTGAATFTILIS